MKMEYEKAVLVELCEYTWMKDIREEVSKNAQS